MRLLLSIPALLSLAAPLSPTAVHAQRLSSLGSDWTLKVQAPPSALQPLPSAPSRPKVGDYRVEGTVIGGLLMGALGAWVGSESCHNQPTPVAPSSGTACTGTTLTVGFVGAVLGGGLGYLLGRVTPKYGPVVGEP